jgi:hypothetical protein
MAKFIADLCRNFFFNLIDVLNNLKIESMLSSMKIQNGAQIQDGRF